MAGRNVLDLVEEIMKKNYDSAPKETKKGLTDPDMDDHGEAVDEPTDELPNYAKSVKKDMSKPYQTAKKVAEEEEDEEDMEDDEDEKETEGSDEDDEEEMDEDLMDEALAEIAEEYELDEEQLDELSRALMSRYVKKASTSKARDSNTFNKRRRGMKMASKALRREDILDEEQLDELSNATLKKYADKAGSSTKKAEKKVEKYSSKLRAWKNTPKSKRKMYYQRQQAAEKEVSKADNREAGVKDATNRVAVRNKKANDASANVRKAYRKKEVKEEFSFANLLNTDTDIDVSDSVNEMFNGTEFTSEFKEKAATLFEAAVNYKIKQIKEELVELVDEAFEEELNAIEEEYVKEIEAIEEELSEEVDNFMKSVMTEWLEENKLAMQSQVRAELAESLMAGMKNLLEEHYIDVPEDKIDILESVSLENEELRAALNEEIAEKTQKHKYIQELEEAIVFNDIVKEHKLTLSQEEKIAELAEGIDYDNLESFEKKLNTLIENYILNEDNSKSSKSAKTELVEDVTIADEELSRIAKQIGNRTKISR